MAVRYILPHRLQEAVVAFHGHERQREVIACEAYRGDLLIYIIDKVSCENHTVVRSEHVQEESAPPCSYSTDPLSHQR